MKTTPPFTPEEIDRLVRATLDADALDVDLPRLQRSIERRVSGAPDVVRLRLRRVISWSAAAAACLVLTATLAHHLLFSPVTANAYNLVSSANSALEPAQDRCYRIEAFRVPPAWLKAVPLLQAAEATSLWSRADRFRATSDRNGKSVLWGQDAQGRLWCAIDRQRAIVFEKREMPARVVEALSYLNLDLRQLTSEILRDYELTTEPSTPGTVLIHAVYKGKLDGRHHFNSVRLEIEQQTSVIRRMEMTRKLGTNEIARFAFVLIAEQPQTDDAYELEHNVEPDAQIYDRTRRSMRNKLYRGLLDS